MSRKVYFGLVFLVCTFFLFFPFTSCNAHKEDRKTNLSQNPLPKRNINNKILIILGKDYYERPKILNYIKNEYGIGEKNSPVQILCYNELVKSTRSPLLRIIPKKIKEYKSNVVISVGIPEGSGRYLINETKKNKDLVIITLLPMDEILPLEASSDIVVDFETPTEILSDETDFKISDEKLEVLITAAVFMGEYEYAKKKKKSNTFANTPIEEFTEALFTTQNFLKTKAFDNNYAVKSYIDPDTGIPSKKYLLIYEKTQNNLQTKKTTTKNKKNINPEQTINPDSL